MGWTGLARISNSWPWERAVLEEVGGGSLAGEEEDFAGGQLACELAIAASMPVIPVMITSEMSMSGAKGVEGLDGFFAAVDSSRFKAGLVEDDGESVGDDLLVVGDEHAGFGRSGDCYCFWHCWFPGDVLDQMCLELGRNSICRTTVIPAYGQVRVRALVLAKVGTTRHGGQRCAAGC